ncbi:MULTISPECIES: ABC transporter substrate-binding protein [unclassified Meiothermus]|uniref:ABC transporter substrate-binding protein n=1 Tax=unclassified Meiothermus TaxID=370471 RepID=UPI000D7BA4F3|nr:MULTISPECIES: ABC transporter substrate-binding protein [unclassified Meiothermus]PZA07646.1 ABC transporter substrate-binding protein [Meiothermus sp. Pnk-1]RYM36483.1 ABC transporter substrate-binding protein [Meiothermus sp. PNK-Is4]
MKRWTALLAVLVTSLPGWSLAQTVTIQYWHINTESFGLPAVRELIAEFQRRNPTVRVEERFQQNAYTGLLQNLQAALAAGNPPDVAQIGYLYTNYVAENFPFVPLTDLQGKFGGDLSRFPANVMALGQVGGVQLGMPYALSNIVTYYNADLFRRAGLNPDQPPQTWAEWRAAARQLKERTGKPIYIQLLDDNWSLEALIASNGGSLLTCQNGHAAPGFAGREAVEALQFWADLVKEGLALNTLWNQGEQAFLAGEAAAYMTTIAKRAGLQAGAQGKFELRGTRFPSFGSKPTRLPGGGNVLVVFAKDPAKQEAAWKFIRFLTSEEGFTIWTKGTGYVPLLPSLADDPRYLKDFIAQNPIQRIGIQQLPNTYRWTSFPGPNGLAASQALFKATQRALGGQASAQTALGEAAQEVSRLLQGEKCVR